MVIDLILISQTWEMDAIGQQVATEIERTVPATIQSATRAEWIAAGQNSINADLVAYTARVNYDGERVCKINGVRRAIYRTYWNEETDEIELYIREEGGVL